MSLRAAKKLGSYSDRWSISWPTEFRVLVNIFAYEQHRLFGWQRASTLEAARAFRNRRGTQLDSARSKTPTNHFERFWNNCRKTNFELITPTYCNSYYNRSKQGKEPIGIPSYHLSLPQSAGKIARTRSELFWLWISLVEKLARDF